MTLLVHLQLAHATLDVYIHATDFVKIIVLINEDDRGARQVEVLQQLVDITLQRRATRRAGPGRSSVDLRGGRVVTLGLDSEEVALRLTALLAWAHLRFDVVAVILRNALVLLAGIDLPVG